MFLRHSFRIGYASYMACWIHAQFDLWNPIERNHYFIHQAMNLCSLPTTSIRILFFISIQIALLKGTQNKLEDIAPPSLVHDKKQVAVDILLAVSF